MRLLTNSTSGMALLSRLPDRQVDKICRHINYYELDQGNRVDIERVFKDLAWIRRIGYCYHENRPTPEVSSMAFPLGETLHGIPLAVGIGGLADRLARRQTQIVAIVRETIAEFKEKAAGRCLNADPATAVSEMPEPAELPIAEIAIQGATPRAQVLAAR